MFFIFDENRKCYDCFQNQYIPVMTNGMTCNTIRMYRDKLEALGMRKDELTALSDSGTICTPDMGTSLKCLYFSDAEQEEFLYLLRERETLASLRKFKHGSSVMNPGQVCEPWGEIPRGDPIVS